MEDLFDRPKAMHERKQITLIIKAPKQTYDEMNAIYLTLEDGYLKYSKHFTTKLNQLTLQLVCEQEIKI